MASTPCAACKLLRRKCTQECVFAPYFPPTNPQKFIYVHKVFGASNVTKILNDLPPGNREDAVNSLYYEAEARMRDPIYGCVGLISFLQQYLKKIQQDLVNAKEELVGYIGSDAVIPPTYLPPQGTNPPPNFMMAAMEGIPPGGGGVISQGKPLIMRDPNLSQQQQNHHDLLLQPQDEYLQLTAAMILDRGDHQQGMFNGYEINENNGSVTATGYNQMDTGSGSLSGPSLALGSFGEGYEMSQETEHGHINHDQLQTQLMLQPPLQEDHQEQTEGQFLMQQPMGHENDLNEEEEEEELEPPVKLRKSEN